MTSFLRTAAALLMVVTFTPLAALIAFPWTWMTGNADFLYGTAMWIARGGLWLAGVRVEVEGREHIDQDSTYIFMCNHVSNLDPPILISKLPRRTSVLVKKELFQVPILGKAMLMGDLVPVDRRNREAAVNSMKQAEAVMAKGLNMTIFPEGTRSLDGRLLPFKKGPFYLAMDSCIPIVPVTIAGSEKLMAKGSGTIHAGIVRLIFHPPISPSEFSEKEDLIAAVRTAIAAPLPAGLPEPDPDSAT